MHRRRLNPVIGWHLVVAQGAAVVGQDQSKDITRDHCGLGVHAQLSHLLGSRASHHHRYGTLGGEGIGVVQPHRVHGESQVAVGGGQGQLLGRSIFDHSDGLAGFNLPLKLGQNRAPVLGHRDRAQCGGVCIRRRHHQVTQGTCNAGQGLAGTGNVVIGLITNPQLIGRTIDGSQLAQVQHGERTGFAAGGDRHQCTASHRLRHTLDGGADGFVGSASGNHNAAADGAGTVIGIGMDIGGQRAGQAT